MYTIYRGLEGLEGEDKLDIGAAHGVEVGFEGGRRRTGRPYEGS